MADGPDAGAAGGLAGAGAAADAGLGPQPAACAVGACAAAPAPLPPKAGAPAAALGPAPTPVTPIINVPNPVILVKKSYLSSPKRKPVKLKTDQAFDGTGTFTVSSGAIRFFTLEKNGVEVSSGQVFPGADLTAGLTVYAQGESPSAAMGDVILTLSLTPNSKPVNPPATDKMTSVEVTLDICESRSTAGVDPAPLSTNDKINIGRFIHAQDASKHRRRAMLIVQKAQPQDYTGTLVLVPKNGRVKIYNAADDPPAAGQAALATAKKPNADIAPGGLKFWAEGVTVSGAKIDTGFKLGVEGVDPDGDEVAVTVFKIDKIEAKLRATPCKRTGARADAMPAKSSTADTKTFDAKAITVVQDCGDLKLTATTTPADVQVTWDVERASDDTGLVGLPTHADDGGDKKRLLTADATGSFHLHAFLDANGNGSRDFDEDGLILNVNMVKVEIMPGAGDNRIFKRNGLFNNLRSTAAQLVVDSGSTGGFAPGVNAAYGDAVFANHPLAMKVTVQLTGGGADQRRGTPQIRLGYIQTTTADSVRGTYADGRHLKEIIVQNAALPGTIVGGAAPRLAFPVRDTRGANTRGTGPFIISSSDVAKSNIAAGGLKRIVRYVDPPAIVLAMNHPVTGSALASISGSNDFAVFLSAYTKDFNENYTVIASAEWSAHYGTFTAVGGWTAVGARITAPAAMTVNTPPEQGESTDVERCTPNFVDNLKMDAR